MPPSCFLVMSLADKFILRRQASSLGCGASRHSWLTSGSVQRFTIWQRTKETGDICQTSGARLVTESASFNVTGKANTSAA